MNIPVEILDEICFHIWVDGHQDTPCQLADEWSKTRSMALSRRDLAVLRLVNKAFKAAASRWLFRHLNAKSKREDPPKTLPLKSVIKLLKVNKCAKHIRFIDFEMDSICARTNTRYVQDLRKYLIIILEDTPHISGLEFHEPSSLLPIDEIMHRLQDLELHVCHLTHLEGPHSTAIPFSTEFSTFPNGAHASSVFKLLDNAINLDRLTIKSVNTLEMVNFEWPSSMRLQYLSLEGIAVAPDDLLSVIIQSTNALKSVHLRRVQFKSSTWMLVLLEMRKYPHLLDVDLEICGHTSTGENSYLADRLVDASWHSD
ncbi:hypothetical protein N7494_001122 [Penicillium frequentans]|uniref:F-box domain-containing protein n=1 Tax=Penicillium frequentans TaxID=3151616 RepID=A0AAD6GM90_9EURO|nr:hypothetical protein N7494_001122 [Penicillium glabrum]